MFEIFLKNAIFGERPKNLGVKQPMRKTFFVISF
jgi:hypothetical protein